LFLNFKKKIFIFLLSSQALTTVGTRYHGVTVTVTVTVTVAGT
jgi:hypothetical protein